MRKLFSWLKKTALWIVILPLVFSYFGAGLNQIVIYANHDRFPVMVSDAKIFEYHTALEEAANSDDPEVAEKAEIRLVELKHGYLDDIHCVMSSKTHLNWLADWIDLHTATYSIGDLFIGLGETAGNYAPVVWVAIVLVRLSRKREEESYAV